MIHCFWPFLYLALSPSRFWLLYLLFSHSPSSSFIRLYSLQYYVQSLACCSRARSQCSPYITMNTYISLFCLLYLPDGARNCSFRWSYLEEYMCVQINRHIHRLLRSRCLECKNDGINTLLDNAKSMMQKIFKSDNKAQRQNNNRSSSNKKTNKSNDSIFPSTFLVCWFAARYGNGSDKSGGVNDNCLLRRLSFSSFRCHASSFASSSKSWELWYEWVWVCFFSNVLWMCLRAQARMLHTRKSALCGQHFWNWCVIVCHKSTRDYYIKDCSALFNLPLQAHDCHTLSMFVLASFFRSSNLVTLCTSLSKLNFIWMSTCVYKF